MIRLLIATTLCLGSCVGTSDLTVQLAREVGALSAAVEELESRLAAATPVRRDDRADDPPPSTASRRRDHHAPAPKPAGGTEPPPPLPPVASGAVVPARPSVETTPAIDPVRELADRVEALRQRLDLQQTRETPAALPASTPAATATTSPFDGPVLPSSAQRPGRFQLAGHGEGAWQTVLDTRTGVVYNFRSVDGEARWVPITRPIGR